MFFFVIEALHAGRERYEMVSAHTASPHAVCDANVPSYLTGVHLFVVPWPSFFPLKVTAFLLKINKHLLNNIKMM